MKKSIVPLIVLCISYTPFAYTFLGPKWPGANPVVDYYFNEKGCADVTDEWDHMRRSFDVWRDVPGTSIDCRDMGVTGVGDVSPDKKNTLMWLEDNDWTLGSSVIAACYVWYQSNTIVDFDIVFNGRDFTWSTNKQVNTMDIGHIATHEVGHALGLGHSSVPGSVMWPTAGFADTAHRRLTSDDSLGITTLYPRTGSNNRVPEITSIPVTQAITGMKYEYQVAATDRDGDGIKFFLSTKPLTMKIDSMTGLITWYPKFLDMGLHQVVVLANDNMNGCGRQAFTISVSNVVVYTANDTVHAGDTLYYPVYVTPIDEYNVLAGNMEFTYNKREVVLLDIDTGCSIVQGGTFVRNIQDSVLRVAFATSKPCAGAGILFRIKMLVFPEHCGECIIVGLKKAFFNDGDPVAVTKNGTIFMPCGDYVHQIDGRVFYCGNNRGVGGARLNLLETGQSATSTQDGYFCFTGVPHSSVQYTVSSYKDSGDTRGAISAYDAAILLQYVVGLHSLETYGVQKNAADVNVNGLLTAFDAALILRYIVGYNDGSGVGHWVMAPPKKVISNLLCSEHNVVLGAYLIGDVSGNWNFILPGRTPKERVATVASVLFNNFCPGMVDSKKGPVPGYHATVSATAITVPVYSGEFEIVFDTDNYTVVSVRNCAALKECILESNVVGRKIKIAFAGVKPILSIGELFAVDVVRKNISATAGAPHTGVITACRFNEYTEGQVGISENPVHNTAPCITGITGIYPNPVLHTLTVSYTLKDAQKVRVAIYDLQGREVSCLVDGMKESGTYSVAWDRKNRYGGNSSVKMYLIRFITKAHSETVKVCGMNR